MRARVHPSRDRNRPPHIGQKAGVLAVATIGSITVLLLLPALSAQGGPATTPMPTPPPTARNLAPTPIPQGTPAGVPPYSPLSTESRGYSDLVVLFSDGLNFDPPLHALGPYNEPIDFNRPCWGENWPYEGCKLFDELADGHEYTVRWEGTLLAPANGYYTFHLANIDDGVQLFLDGSLVVDRNWNYPNPDTIGPVRTLPLDTGYHRIRINYRQTVPYVASAQVRWNGPGFADEVIPVFSFECPLAEAISLRRLDDRTLGVVGFVEPRGYNGRQIETATLRAIAGGTLVSAEDDLVDLANQSVPGGSPDEIPETAGLWSTVLRADGPFPRQFRLELETTDGSGETCVEKTMVSLEDSGWAIETENIDALGATDPAGGGIPLVAGRGLNPLGAPPITVRLSRYTPNPASKGLPGTWDTIAQKQYSLTSEFWFWDFNVPANFVDPGENLYRAVAVRAPQEGVEDLDGFYAVSLEESLATDGNLQRRQALAFRDAARAAVGINACFPEALLVAMGTLESADAFDNAHESGNGIMQVTCSSGRKGFTETGEQRWCGADPPAPDYEATRQSIEFNVLDAIWVLNDRYSEILRKPREGDFIYYAGTEDRVDVLTTAVVRYNAGNYFFWNYSRPCKCEERGYPGVMARRLRPLGGDPWPSVAELLDDADYDPGAQDVADFGTA